jgi:hypothetical protein
MDQEKGARLEAVRDIVTKDEVKKAQEAILTDENKFKSLAYELEQLRFRSSRPGRKWGIFRRISRARH